MFHRLVLPTYWRPSGDLLSGYDLLNTPSHVSVGGTGTPALWQGKKPVGPNAGTYFVAFNEDGLSEYANRPAHALGENTDILDNIVRESIPRLTSFDFTTGTPPATTSVVGLTGDVFVGVAGTANTQAQRDLLVHIVDLNDNEFEVGGSKVQVTLVHDGSNNNVIGTAGGFYTNPSLTFSPALPNATAFRVYVGLRSNYADISLDKKGALFGPQVKSSQRVEATLRSLLRQLHAVTGQNWDASWDASIQALASAGLNERYNRATLVPGSYTYNSPGNGRLIDRTGGAVELRGPVQAISAVAWPDPFMALMRLSSAASIALPNGTEAPDLGVVREIAYRTAGVDAGELTQKTRSGPSLLDVMVRNNAATVAGLAAYTYCPPGSPGVANPDAATSNATVQLDAPFYFRNGGNTSLRMGVDFVELTFPGGIVQTFVVQGFDGGLTSAITLRRLSGTSPTTLTANTPVTVRWLAPTLSAGGAFGDNSAYSGLTTQAGFMCLRPRRLNTAIPDPVHPAAMFADGELNPANLGGEVQQYAVTRFGYFDTLGTFIPTRFLYGDGSTTSMRGRQSSVVACTAFVNEHITAAPPATVTWNADSYGMLSIWHEVNASSITVAFDVTSTYVPRPGDQLTVMFHREMTSVTPCTITWPASFVFSGSDGDLSTVPPGGRVRFELRYDDGNKFYAVRTDY